jgi:hypothetical protein
MNDDDLNRLLRAARKANAPRPTLGDGLPFGFDTRVLAHWKTQAGAGSELARLALFRQALVAACAIALASGLIGYRSLQSSPSPELALANYAMETGDTL